MATATTVIVHVKAKPSRRDALVEFLKEVQPLASGAGCETIAVHPRHGSEDDLIEIEYWEDRAAYETFVKAAGDAGEFDSLADLLAAPFEISYLDPALKTDA